MNVAGTPFRRKDVSVHGVARLFRDHVERELGQREVAAGILFSRVLRDAPNIIDDVIVPHRGDLLLPLGG